MRPGSRFMSALPRATRTLAVAADGGRCSVWTLHADAVIYRGALRFEEACTALWEEQAHLGCELVTDPP